MDKLEQFSASSGGSELRQKQILEQFSPEEREEMLRKKEILSSLAQFIGKDFNIPVELNSPGGGWHWDFGNNIIRIDPKDLLERSIGELRFLISHEGSHRRISRAKEIVPDDILNAPGFALTWNAIEDPRVNNFLKEAYPRAKDQMRIAYDKDLGFIEQTKKETKERLGFQPRFMRAGFEFLIQWHREARGEEFELSEELPEEVREAVEETLKDAQKYWWRYPSKKEAEEGEENIERYMKSAFNTLIKKIWPAIEKLVEKDKQDQQMQEMLKDMQEQAQGEQGAGGGLPQELKEHLTEEQEKELEEAIKEAIDRALQEPEEEKDKTASKAVDLDSLSDDLKEKIKEYIDSLPQEQKEKLKEKAERELASAEKEATEEMHEGVHPEMPGTGIWDEAPEHREENKHEEKTDKQDKKPKETEEKRKSREKVEKGKEEVRKATEAILKEAKNAYEEKMREVLPIIDRLEEELREIFVNRRMQNWKGGFRVGKRISIKKRMQEKAKGISAVQSKAWQKREAPQEKDYAITLLVDLSGSMRGQKINETFKAVIVLTEVLNRLSIKTEILGFNDRVHEFKKFEQSFNDELREKMGSMLEEVQSQRAAHNDDGWALEQAAERLAVEDAVEKFLIALSDGQPAPSVRHSGPEYDLKKVADKITHELPEKLIGLGIGPGTKHVEEYYPYSIANVSVREMAEKLADLIYDVIVHYDKF